MPDCTLFSSKQTADERQVAVRLVVYDAALGWLRIRDRRCYRTQGVADCVRKAKLRFNIKTSFKDGLACRYATETALALYICQGVKS